MSFADILRSVLPRYKKTSDEVEEKLSCAHKRIANFAARVDMLYPERNDYLSVGAAWEAISAGVRADKCQLPTIDSTILNVVFDPRSVLPTHHHKDREESIYVVEGEIVDESRDVRIGTNQVYVIPTGVDHTIYSERGAKLNVVFRPKYPEDMVPIE